MAISTARAADPLTEGMAGSANGDTQMKRNLVVLAAALANWNGCNALAAGHGGGHMGGRFGEPLIGSAPMTSLISNPSTPYTVTQSPEVHVRFPETG